MFQMEKEKFPGKLCPQTILELYTEKPHRRQLVQLKAIGMSRKKQEVLRVLFCFVDFAVLGRSRNSDLKVKAAYFQSWL